MDQALRVDGGQALADLRGDAAELVGGVAALRLLLADVGVERLPGDLLHHQDGAPEARREVVDAAHVGVADRARQEQLLPERLVVAGHARLFAHDLEGDGLLGRAIERQEDLAHASFAEALTDLVPVVDDRARGDRRGRVCFRHVGAREILVSLGRALPVRSRQARRRTGGS